MNDKIQKLDQGWIGFIVGLISPMIIFFMYWLLFHHQISFPMRFLHYLMGGYLLSNVIKMCGLINLLVFYGGLRYKIDRFSRGIIFSVIVYVGLIAYVTYYLEPELI